MTDSYYEKYWQADGTGYRPTENREAAALYERRFPDHDADCLDVGCGNGKAIGAFLSDRCRTYVGVDVSDAAVTMAREVGLNAQTIADGSDLPLADASVDFVACLEVMEHVFTSEETAAEMYRVLRPGGTLIVQVPNVAHWRHRFDLGVWGRFVALGDHQTLTRPWRDPHIRFYTFDAMRRLLQYTGFDITEVSGIGGNQAAHVPLLGKHIRNEHAGPLSRRLFQMRPGLFANRILIAATR